MAQFRQSGTDRSSGRAGYQNYSSGGAASSSDHVAIGIRNGGGGAKANRWRRSVRADRIRRLGIGSVVFVLCLVLVVTVLAYYDLSGYTNYGYDDKELDSYEGDFLTNVTRLDTSKVLEFGQGSVVNGRDSRYWDKDDRREAQREAYNVFWPNVEFLGVVAETSYGCIYFLNLQTKNNCRTLKGKFPSDHLLVLIM